MNKTWIIAPWNNQRPHWDEIWQYDSTNNLISLGWSWLGDAISFRQEKLLKARIKELKPATEKDSVGRIYRKINFFINEIQQGDTIIARKGLKEAIGIGECTGPAFFSEIKAINSGIQLYDHKLFLPVKWNNNFVPVVSERNIFNRSTIEPLKNESELPDEIKYHLVAQRNRSVDKTPPAYDRIDLDHIELGNEFPDRFASHGFRFQRDESVRKFVLKRANGTCEYCGKKGFLTKDGNHYIETHHIIALSEDGPDTPGNVIGLCPEHHREAHYGQDSIKLEIQFMSIIKRKNEPNQ